MRLEGVSRTITEQFRYRYTYYFPGPTYWSPCCFSACCHPRFFLVPDHSPVVLGFSTFCSLHQFPGPICFPHLLFLVLPFFRVCCSSFYLFPASVVPHSTYSPRQLFFILPVPHVSCSSFYLLPTSVVLRSNCFPRQLFLVLPTPHVSCSSYLFPMSVVPRSTYSPRQLFFVLPVPHISCSSFYLLPTSYLVPTSVVPRSTYSPRQLFVDRRKYRIVDSNKNSIIMTITKYSNSMTYG